MFEEFPFGRLDTRRIFPNMAPYPHSSKNLPTKNVPQHLPKVPKRIRQIPDGISYRRVEFVGPKVSSELVRAGSLASLLAVVAMLIYIWFRFEWQFALGAVLALVHDVILTIGIFALTRLEFNLSIVAAILTIVGYSVNDTVVVYDRIRENLRRYRKMAMVELLNVSINDTLSRTTMTSVTTLIALLTLFFFGGAVIQGFTFAMIWGVLIGTYSSIFIAAPLLLYVQLRRDNSESNSIKEDYIGKEKG